MILDSLSYKTGYFFSYNAEILPKGSRFSISGEDEPLDKFLSTLLTGTGLDFSIYRDQIILNYKPVLEPRKKAFFTISGILTDEDNNPIAQANVFLDGTSIGTISDSSGVYNITGIPPGIYDLVVSHIGYTQNTFRISEYEGSSRIVNATLSPSIQILEEVEIVARQVKRGNTEWINYYQLFKTELLGKTKNSRSCVIENPEVLNFLFEERTQTLRVFAKSPIMIRNDALGYRISYFLETFTKSPEDLRYRGKLRFRNIDAPNKGQQKFWKRQRRKSYLGSFNHFKRALLDERLEKEGFKIYSLKRIEPFKKDNLKVMKEKDLLAYKGDHYSLSFKDYLLVEFKREKETQAFLDESSFTKFFYADKIDAQGELQKTPTNQTSIIGLLKSKTRVDLEGQVMDKFAVTTYGYWAWERAGDLVPSNYDPRYENF